MFGGETELKAKDLIICIYGPYVNHVDRLYGAKLFFQSLVYAWPSVVDFLPVFVKADPHRLRGLEQQGRNRSGVLAFLAGDNRTFVTHPHHTQLCAQFPHLRCYVNYYEDEAQITYL